MITAGNASQLSDGASASVVMSQKRADRNWVLMLWEFILVLQSLDVSQVRWV